MRQTAFVFAALCLCALGARAGQVSYLPLTNVIRQAQWVFRARVVSVDRKDTEQETRIEYVVSPSRTLMGQPSLPAKVKLSYAEVVPVIRDANGKEIGWFSPIFSGSGNEFSIKPDQEWIFLLTAIKFSADNPTGILRAEPVSHEKEIERMLSQQPDRTRLR